MSGDPPRLALDHVCKSFGAFTALDDIALAVPTGMFVSLLGPSGCGKTTLLRLIAGSIAPDRGRVLVDGEDMADVPTWRRRMGMVFQTFALFPYMTVAANVAFPLEVRRESERSRRERVSEALKMVHLEGQAEKYPRQLSGGQQQRVGLARAIVYRPRILLLDEPLSNLDAALREELRLEIGEVTRRLEITAVYVTHDQREALALSDRIALMRAGRIVQYDTPEAIHKRPTNAFVANFVGYANRLPIEIQGSAGRLADGIELTLGETWGISGPAIAFVHASDLKVTAGGQGVRAENVVSCHVAAVAFMGDYVEYVLQHGEALRLKAEVRGSTKVFPRGAAVDVWLPPEKMIIVPAGDDERGQPSRAVDTGSF